jgi:hypothetical protein
MLETLEQIKDNNNIGGTYCTLETKEERQDATDN